MKRMQRETVCQEKRLETHTLTIAVRRSLGASGAAVMLSISPMVLADSPFAAVVELSDLAGSEGFVINGVDAADLSGRSVSGAGDINGDGMDDVIIGADNADPNGNSGAGNRSQ